MQRKKLKKTKGGCWEYTGVLNAGGYGPHRNYYRIFTGITVPNNKTIDHLCRNRKCLNPKHLEIVELAENKRRASKKITYEIVKEIKYLYKIGIIQIKLAKKFKVNQSTISRIINGLEWYEL